MRKFATLIPIVCLLLSSATLLGEGEPRKQANPEPPAEVKVALELRTTTPKIRLGEQPSFTAKLTNSGNRSVTVVLPGDGSVCGWRTPVLTWSPSVKNGGRCGNINRLREKEVVTLAPGKSVDLDWLDPPAPGLVGKHKMSLTYENKPDLRWMGTPLGVHDPKAMEKVRSSTALKVTSNVVEIEVLPAKGE